LGVQRPAPAELGFDGKHLTDCADRAGDWHSPLAETGAGCDCNRTRTQKVQGCGVGALRVQQRVAAVGVGRGWHIDKIAGAMQCS